MNISGKPNVPGSFGGPTSEISIHNPMSVHDVALLSTLLTVAHMG